MRAISTFRQFLAHRVRTNSAIAIIAVLMAGYGQLSHAQKSSQKTFTSAEQASQALLLAVQNNDEQAITKILGAGKELASAGDEVQNKLERERFVRKYQEMHRLVLEPDKTTVLYIGAENWPFPVPLVLKNGAWCFDYEAGMREVLFRRIGENEVAVEQSLHALIQAKQQHQTGLEAGETSNPLGALLVKDESGSKASKNDGAVLYQGYYFRILTGHGTDAPNAKTNDGFALIAYPVEYRSSGVTTFIVNQDGVVYEKDLGPKTAQIVRAMTKYEPDSTWQATE